MNKMVVGVSLPLEVVVRLKEEKKRTGVNVSQQVVDALCLRWLGTGAKPEAKEENDDA